MMGIGSPRRLLSLLLAPFPSGSFRFAPLLSPRIQTLAAAPLLARATSSTVCNAATAASTPLSMPSSTTGYLSAADAYALDQELMAKDRFTLEQLMELAGLAVAEAIVQVLPLDDDAAESSTIWILCGPGNNGGDGLVAARHLTHFLPTTTHIHVVYPKRPFEKQPHYAKLVQQCEDLHIPIHTELPETYYSYRTTTGRTVLVDAMFGFSFRGTPRPPFDALIEEMRIAASNATITTVSVDIPSGWSVDDDDDRSVVADDRWMPDVLVSLTAPKLCAKRFTGRHFVGGRFLPPALAQKYNIRMPPYPGVQQVMELL